MTERWNEWNDKGFWTPCVRYWGTEQAALSKLQPSDRRTRWNERTRCADQLENQRWRMDRTRRTVHHLNRG